MADLAGGALVALDHVPIDRDDPADTGTQGEADDRPDAATRTEPQLGQPEGAGVVDERGRQPESLADRRRHGDATPAAGHVDQELGRAGQRVIQTGHPDAHGYDGRMGGDDLCGDPPDVAPRLPGLRLTGSVPGRRR